MPSKIPTTTTKRFYLECGAPTMLKITSIYQKPPEFKINPDYSEEEELVNIIAEFSQAYASNKIDNEGYVAF